jgi:hypothetical protein
MYVDVDQLDAAHHHAAHVDTAEPALGQVAGTELRTAEVNTLESGSPEILAEEITHVGTVPSRADDGSTTTVHGACGDVPRQSSKNSTTVRTPASDSSQHSRASTKAGAVQSRAGGSG